MSTAPVSGATSTTASLTNVASGAQALGEQAFLQLLTTQLQYQDPLQPMDNTAFVSQLAQFSQLEQLSNLNQTMTGMGSNLSNLNNNLDSNLIGRNVTVQGGSIMLGQSSLPALVYALSDNATQVVLSVTDGAGNLVKTIPMGPQSSGMQSVTWDGTNNAGYAATPGNYNYSVSSVDASGNSIPNTTYITGPVSGITLNSGTAYLTVNGASVPASSLYQINQ